MQTELAHERNKNALLSLRKKELSDVVYAQENANFLLAGGLLPILF